MNGAGLAGVCVAGEREKEVPRRYQTRPNRVIKWRRRFVQHGLAGLRDAPRPGAKPVYGAEFRNRVLALLEKPPPAGQACWDGPAVATALKGSVHAVWRVLRHEGICLQRQRSWCVSTDKEFAAKAADIVGLYLNPPEKALVISVDEKPSIQALERRTGYVETDNGRIVRGLKSTYKSHRTPNPLPALGVATGRVTTSITQLKRREEFLQFMDQGVAETPAEQELQELLAPLELRNGGRDFSGGYLQRGEEVECAVAFLSALQAANNPAVVRFNIAGPSLQGLNTGFLVNRDHQRLLGWIKIQPHDVRGFGGKLLVGAHTPGALPLQADSLMSQNPPHCMHRSLQRGGDSRTVPARLARRRRLLQKSQHPVAELRAINRFGPGSRRIAQARQAVLDETAAPLDHPIGTGLISAGHLFFSLTSHTNPGQPRSVHSLF